MLDMEIANKILFEQSLSKFPLGIVELDVNDLQSGMVLAEDVKAVDDLPPFRASVMVKPTSI